MRLLTLFLALLIAILPDICILRAEASGYRQVPYD